MQACQVLRLKFVQIAQVEVFLEAVIIASARNSVLRRLLLKPDTTVPISTGAYRSKMNYSKK
jgi:hypothetical protein